MKAFRVWCIWNNAAAGTSYETLASTAYEKESRVNDLAERARGRETRQDLRFEVRPETVPGEIVVNGIKRSTRIVVLGDDNHHTRL